MSYIIKRPRIILFGDSLTEKSFSFGGWGAGLANNYNRRADVVNRGLSGYNTRWALYTMPEFFGDCTKDNTLLVTLFFGANDAAKPDGTPHSARQHVPVAEYKDNLLKVVDQLREKGIQRIVMLTPPPVYEPGRKEAQIQRVGAAEAAKLELDRTNEYTKQYADACKEAAKQADAVVIDLWTLMQGEKDWGTKLFNDGLHFTVEGNQMVYDVLQRTINTTYPELRSENLAPQFPNWDAIDLADPASTFKEAYSKS
eukprot:CAMPEP_0202896324 /NCGR_PEP_ID=MMETSP1392-20130828/5346_1 /ASSEMBLY_ACC=CAM_ASM_000868 /TAXON_ID=225041 /ORGANISM="Chlamydomonas chlamydogama, Strain SAG 11-48b" /LENGTH=254 /DNA_ID=CAMNT_0049581637 /DNA_START=243 /DNA_END=1007 /DNA_ORIENTATION=-